MTEYEIFQSRHNPEHYVAVVAGSDHPNAVRVRASQNLQPVARIRDDGSPHLGFDATAARSGVAGDGFYAFAVTIQSREPDPGW